MPDTGLGRKLDARTASNGRQDRMPDTSLDRKLDAGTASNGRQDKMPDTSLDSTPDVAFDMTRTPDARFDKTIASDTSLDMTSFTTVVENSDWTHAYQCDPAFSSIYRSPQAGSLRGGHLKEHWVQP